MSDAMDTAVAAALAEAGLGVSRFRCLSKHKRQVMDRVAYRIDLESGRTIKARRLEDARAARRQQDIRRDLPSAFAPVLDRHGSVLLEEWIEGEPVEPNEGVLGEAAALLALLHGREDLLGRPTHAIRPTAPLRADTEESLRQVLASGLLDDRDGTLLREALDRLDPGQAMHGLVHLDFCGENMLLDRVGRLRVIDNERLGLGPLGWDLGRARYRWGLTKQHWQRFRAAYAARLPRIPPADDEFWFLVALVRGTALRLRAYPDLVHGPARELRNLVACLRDPHARESPL